MVEPHLRHGGGVTGPPGQHSKQQGISRIAGGRMPQTWQRLGLPVTPAGPIGAAPAWG